MKYEDRSTMTTSLHIIDIVTSDETQKFEPAGRVAAAIVDITREKGGCLPQDLNERGFTPDEVVVHWHLAQSLASVELKHLRDKPNILNALFRRG